MKTPVPIWLLGALGCIIAFILAQFIDGRIALLIGFVFIIVAIYMRSHRIKKLMNKLGLTAEEWALVHEDLRKGNCESATERIAQAQERTREKFKEKTGIDITQLTPEVGRDISWADIVYHAFRVLEFDRMDTTIDENNQVVASSSVRPYGYLLVESPILNYKVKFPIIHRDDFFLAASVFDEPALAGIGETGELLVTYAPERLLPKGLSGSPSHVLHYVIAPRGTLDAYYSINDDMHMAKPDPQKLFGPFVYHGKIGVQINSEPKL